MGEQTKNMLIGVFVIAACGIIVWLVMFLKPSVGNGKETLYVRFSNVNQINVGTRVLFAGRPVGEVVAIQQIRDARQKPISDVLGEIYTYQLTLKVDSSVKVYDTDKITVQTTGLLGEKSIAIIPQVPPKGIVPKLITNQPIYAESVDPLESAFNSLTTVSKEIKKVFQQISQWMKEHGNQVADAVCSFRNAMDEATTTLHTFNEQNLVSDIKQGIAAFTKTACDIQDAIAQLNQGNVFSNAGCVMQNLKTTTENTNIITCDLAQGRGTLGKLIKSDGLYLHVQALLSKADHLMNAMNHYGLLFNLNKSWQREQAQRVTVLNALDNPQNFKRFFENEVDDINLALTRIGMLIDKAQLKPENEEILKNPRFKKDFEQLLRQSEQLSDHLKLYNEYLEDASEGSNGG